MTTLTPQITVGEIAAHRPDSIRVFEKHGIDYCCGGQVALAEACAAKGLDAGALLAEVESIPTPDSRDWTGAPLPELVDHILDTHHEYLKAELPRIAGILDKVQSAHKYEAIPAVAAVYANLHAELDGHLMKEEMVLFPLIRTLVRAATARTAAPPSHCGSVRNPLRVMLMEHDSAGSALAEMRRLTGGYALPEGACNTLLALYTALQDLERDLHRHIHLENNILFPRAVEVEDSIAG